MNHPKRSRFRRRHTAGRIVVILVVLVAVGVARVVSPGCANSAPVGPAETFPAYTPIALSAGDWEVVDGDTIKVRGQTVRFLGCDTPESASPFFVGDQEPHASNATRFVENQLRQAATVTLQVTDQKDRYGRWLGHVFVDGRSLSLQLVEAGLAYETISTYGHSGFPELAQEIKNAAQTTQRPFERPADWRRQNRKPGR